MDSKGFKNLERNLKKKALLIIPVAENVVLIQNRQHTQEKALFALGNKNKWNEITIGVLFIVVK